MQMPTHLITGALIEEAVNQIDISKKEKNIVIFLLGLLSHGILDAFSIITYHPPQPMPKDKFWVVYHKLILPAISIIIFSKFWKNHKLGMVSGMLPDIDWVIRDINAKNNNLIHFWGKPILNQGLLTFVKKLPVIKQTNQLPDWRFKKSTVLIEVAVIFAFSMLTLLLQSRRK